MAKRKKATGRRKTSHRKRRARVGAIDFQSIALTVGGAVAANVITNTLSKSSSSLAQKVAPFAGIGAGIVLPMFVKGPVISQLSVGLIAGGGVAALGQNGLKVIGAFNNAIAYPGSMKNLPYGRPNMVAGIGQSAQGLTRGTHSNFSGSRRSQINTIAGVAGLGCNGSGAGTMN